MQGYAGVCESRGGGSLKSINPEDQHDQCGHSNTPLVPQGHGGGYIIDIYIYIYIYIYIDRYVGR